MSEYTVTKFSAAVQGGQGGDTLSAYARRLRVSRQTLRDWITGKRAPLVADLPRIARTLNVSVTDLVED